MKNILIVILQNKNHNKMRWLGGVMYDGANFTERCIQLFTNETIFTRSSSETHGQSHVSVCETGRDN